MNWIVIQYMKAVLLNGARKNETLCDAAYEGVRNLMNEIGLQLDSVLLRDTEIEDCSGCFGCWVKTPGTCVIDDGARDIARMMVQSDLTILLTPVTFGGYSSELKKALDRVISLISPLFMKVHGEVHHKPRYDIYPRLIGIGILERPDEESEGIFTALVGRNAVNFHSPAHASEVWLSGQSMEMVQKRMRTLLNRVGVGA